VGSTNYQQIKHQILDSILEGRNTSALSLKLGYSFDKVRRWQNGSKQLRWNEFCDLCVHLKVPLFETFGLSLGIIFHQKEDALGIVENLKIFSRIESSNELAKRMHISLSALKRYLSQETYPDIEFVLEMIDLRSHFLENFVDRLLGRTSMQERNFLSLPWAAAVANAAALPSHQGLPEHSNRWIAGLLGISESQVEQAIELMVKLEMIERKGPHFGPTLSRTIAVNRQTSPMDYAKFIRFWIKRCETRFTTTTGEPINRTLGPNKDVFRIFSASPSTSKKITEILIRTEQEIHDLLQQKTDEKTDVRVLLMHHFSGQDFHQVTSASSQPSTDLERA
jgi:hypothetical protein